MSVVLIVVCVSQLWAVSANLRAISFFLHENPERNLVVELITCIKTSDLHCALRCSSTVQCSSFTTDGLRTWLKDTETTRLTDRDIGAMDRMQTTRLTDRDIGAMDRMQTSRSTDRDTGDMDRMQTSRSTDRDIGAMQTSRPTDRDIGDMDRMQTSRSTDRDIGAMQTSGPTDRDIGNMDRMQTSGPSDRKTHTMQTSPLPGKDMDRMQTDSLPVKDVRRMQTSRRLPNRGMQGMMTSGADTRAPCQRLPRLNGVIWRTTILKGKGGEDRVVVAECEIRERKRVIPCSVVMRFLPAIEKDCSKGTWTYMGKPGPQMAVSLPYRLNDIAILAIHGVYSDVFAISLHSSTMPHYHVEFAICGYKVNVETFRSGKRVRKKGSKLTKDEMHVPGKTYTLKLRNNKDTLEYQLSRGMKSCRVSIPDLLASVDKLTVHQAERVKLFRVYPIKA